FWYWTWSWRDISGWVAIRVVPRWSRACQSSTVIGARSAADAIPPNPRCWPGLTVSSVVPRAAIRWLTACWAPRPRASIAITAPTPMTMPSMVSAERSLFAPRASRATRRVSPNIMSAASSGTGPRSPGCAGSTPDARNGAADALPDARQVLLPLLLELAHAQQRHLLALLEPRDDFGVVVVADSHADQAG